MRTADTGDNPRQEVFLVPGQQLIAERNAPTGTAAYSIRSINVNNVIAWRTGHVFIEDMSLADAAAEMNRYSQVQIVLGEPALRTLRVSGMFRIGEQEVFASALEQYFPIKVQHRSDRLIELVARAPDKAMQAP